MAAPPKAGKGREGAPAHESGEAAAPARAASASRGRETERVPQTEDR